MKSSVSYTVNYFENERKKLLNGLDGWVCDGDTINYSWINNEINFFFKKIRLVLRIISLKGRWYIDAREEVDHEAGNRHLVSWKSADNV